MVRRPIQPESRSASPAATTALPTRPEVAPPAGRPLRLASAPPIGGDTGTARLAPPPTRIGQVMDAVRGRIAARQLTPGEKLPSVRAQAGTLGVSISTVVEAYERLAAEGLIRSRPGSGWTVTAPLAPLALARIDAPRERAVDPFWVSRQSLEADDARWRPGCGWLPADWLPQDALRRALRGLGRAEATVLADYGPPQGHPALRTWLARRMAEHGVAATPQQIVLTGSGTQAIDLVCRFLLEPGDAVLVDDPCYFNFLAVLRAHRAQVVGVPWTPDGPDVAAFEAAVATHRPRLYLTNAGVHNPSGATLSAPVAHRVLRLAEAAGLTIVEDEVFADFESRPSPRYVALDGLQRVVQVGSFSKVMSAAVRSGHIAARPDWIEGLTDLRLATTFGGDALAAALVLAVLRDGQWRRHLETLRLRLARARRTVADRLQALGIRPWLVPQAGLFLWCELPAGVDAAALSRAALARGLVLAPGDVFSPGRTAGSRMRFNVAQMVEADAGAPSDGLWPTLQALLREVGGSGNPDAHRGGRSSA